MDVEDMPESEMLVASFFDLQFEKILHPRCFLYSLVCIWLRAYLSLLRYCHIIQSFLILYKAGSPGFLSLLNSFTNQDEVVACWFKTNSLQQSWIRVSNKDEVVACLFENEFACAH